MCQVSRSFWTLLLYLVLLWHSAEGANCDFSDTLAQSETHSACGSTTQPLILYFRNVASGTTLNIQSSFVANITIAANTTSFTLQLTDCFLGTVLLVPFSLQTQFRLVIDRSVAVCALFSIFPGSLVTSAATVAQNALQGSLPSVKIINNQPGSVCSVMVAQAPFALVEGTFVVQNSLVDFVAQDASVFVYGDRGSSINSVPRGSFPSDNFSQIRGLVIVIHNNVLIVTGANISNTSSTDILKVATVVSFYEGNYLDTAISITQCNTTLKSDGYTFFQLTNQLVGVNGRTSGRNASFEFNGIRHKGTGWRVSMFFWLMDNQTTAWWQDVKLAIRTSSFVGTLDSPELLEFANILVVRLFQDGVQAKLLPVSIHTVLQDVAVEGTARASDTKLFTSQFSGNFSVTVLRCTITASMSDGQASFVDARPRQESNLQLEVAGIQVSRLHKAPALFSFGETGADRPTLFSMANLTFHDIQFDNEIPGTFVAFLQAMIVVLHISFLRVSVDTVGGLIGLNTAFVAALINLTVQASSIQGILYLENGGCVMGSRLVSLIQVKVSLSIVASYAPAPLVKFETSADNCNRLAIGISRFAPMITAYFRLHSLSSYCVNDEYVVRGLTILDSGKPTFLFYLIKPEGMFTLPLCVSTSDDHLFPFAGVFLSDSVTANWSVSQLPPSCVPTQIATCTYSATRSLTIESSTLRFYSSNALPILYQTHPAAVVGGFAKNLRLSISKTDVTLDAYGSGSSILWAPSLDNVTVHVYDQVSLQFGGLATPLINISGLVNRFSLVCGQGVSFILQPKLNGSTALLSLIGDGSSLKNSLITLRHVSITLRVSAYSSTGAMIDFRNGTLTDSIVSLNESTISLECASTPCRLFEWLSLVQLGGRTMPAMDATNGWRVDGELLSFHNTTILLSNNIFLQNVNANGFAVIQTGFTVGTSSAQPLALLSGSQFRSVGSMPSVTWQLVSVNAQTLNESVPPLSAVTVRAENNQFMMAIVPPTISRCVGATLDPGAISFLIPSAHVETGCNNLFSNRPSDCRLRSRVESMIAQVTPSCGSFTDPLTLTVTKELTISTSCPLPEIVEILSLTEAPLVAFYNDGFNVQLRLNTALQIEGYTNKEPGIWVLSNNEVMISRYFAVERARIRQVIATVDDSGELTVLTLQLSTVNPVLLSTTIVVRLTILPFAFQCLIQKTLTHSIKFRGRDSFVPAALRDGTMLTNGATNAVASLASSSFAVSSASSIMWRSNLLLSLSTCAFSDTSPLAPGDSPTQMEIPGSRPEGMYYRGAVVGGLLLIYGFMVILACRGVCRSLWELSGEKEKDRTVRGAIRALLRCFDDTEDDASHHRRLLWRRIQYSWIVVQLPGAATGLLFSVGPGVLSAATSLLAPMGGSEDLSPTAEDIILALVGFGGVLLLVGLFILRIVIKFPCVPRPRDRPVDLTCLGGLTFPTVKWTRGPAFREQYGALFDCYVSHYWAILDIAMCAVLGILAGLRPKTEAGCNALLVVVTALCLLSSVVVVWRRPFSTLLDNIVLVVTSGCQAAAGILTLISVFDTSRDDEDEDSPITAAADILSTFVFVVSSLSILISLLPLIVGKIQVMCSQSERTRDEEDSSSSLPDDTRTNEVATTTRRRQEIMNELAKLTPKLAALIRTNARGKVTNEQENLRILVSYICLSKALLAQPSVAVAPVHSRFPRK